MLLLFLSLFSCVSFFFVFVYLFSLPPSSLLLSPLRRCLLSPFILLFACTLAAAVSCLSCLCRKVSLLGFCLLFCLCPVCFFSVSSLCVLFCLSFFFSSFVSSMSTLFELGSSVVCCLSAFVSVSSLSSPFLCLLCVSVSFVVMPQLSDIYYIYVYLSPCCYPLCCCCCCRASEVHVMMQQLSLFPAVFQLPVFDLWRLFCLHPQYSMGCKNTTNNG